MSTQELPEYANVVAALTPVLADFPAKIIAIGGHPSSGKTSLGRYLAWQFNVSLIETDLFLDDGRGKWPAPGSADTELGVLMEREVGHGETDVYAGVQA